MNNKEIISKGCELLSSAAMSCGAEFEFLSDINDEILVDDEDILSFTTMMKVVPFGTDDGTKKPPAVMFQLDYDKVEKTFVMEMGEDNYCDITYGNVMAMMYFSCVT